MIYYDVGNLIVASIPKNAGTSIRHTLYKHLNVNEVSSNNLPNKTIITFIRNPIERLQSCYWKFSNTYWPKQNWETYEDFVDGVLSGATDRHWDLQVKMLTGKETLYHFESINDVFTMYNLPKLAKRNVSKKEKIDVDYRIDDLVKWYESDFEVKKRIVNS